MKIVTWKTIVFPSEDYLTKNGRVKLAEVGKVVTDAINRNDTGMFAMGSEDMLSNNLRFKVSECMVASNHYYIRRDSSEHVRTIPAVKISITKAMLRFHNIRRLPLLSERNSDIVNTLPRLKAEDMILLILQQSSLVLMGGMSVHTPVYLEMQNGDYTEQTWLYLGEPLLPAYSLLGWYLHRESYRISSHFRDNII